MQPSLNGSNKIGIVGMGLIGGSLGLDLQSLGYEVFGVTNKESTAIRAKERGLAQVVSTDRAILSNCSVIILALPISQLIEPSEELINALPKQAIITDVGSVKIPIEQKWQHIHSRFIPSHPMAGTAKSGIEAGQKQLFSGRPWVTTVSNNTDRAGLKVINELALALGSQWITVDAKTHDEAVALISHLPLFISAALLKTVGENTNNSLLSLAKTLASSGFADTTRVGGGNPKLGVDIATHNTKVLLNALHDYRHAITRLEDLIQSNQWNELQKELEQVQEIRPEFL